MWLAEDLQVFVIGPLFHSSIHWDSPLVPLFITLFILMPVGYMILKSMKHEHE